MKITEQKLRELIKESVSTVISEMGTLKQNALLKKLTGSDEYANLSVSDASKKIDSLLADKGGQKASDKQIAFLAKMVAKIDNDPTVIENMKATLTFRDASSLIDGIIKRHDMRALRNCVYDEWSKTAKAREDALSRMDSSNDYQYLHYGTKGRCVEFVLNIKEWPEEKETLEKIGRPVYYWRDGKVRLLQSAVAYNGFEYMKVGALGVYAKMEQPHGGDPIFVCAYGFYDENHEIQLLIGDHKRGEVNPEIERFCQESAMQENESIRHLKRIISESVRQALIRR